MDLFFLGEPCPDSHTDLCVFCEPEWGWLDVVGEVLGAAEEEEMKTDEKEEEEADAEEEPEHEEEEKPKKKEVRSCMFGMTWCSV